MRLLKRVCPRLSDPRERVRIAKETFSETVGGSATAHGPRNIVSSYLAGEELREAEPQGEKTAEEVEEAVD
jgi:hypothetical protein